MTIKRAFATFIAVLSALCASAGLTPRQKELLGHSLVHRGDGKGRPDNTMEALLYTWGRGYAPESDIRYTKAGWKMGFDSFGSDYPEAIYKAIEELDKEL